MTRSASVLGSGTAVGPTLGASMVIDGPEPPSVLLLGWVATSGLWDLPSQY
jgi:hypothetical protein